ncbi:hypothetical protein [Fodinicola feengrottensis]|uniref:hypothetical protein n=1 Tax=Fodinicola feengrottensis TaxID=435914 RepID=UPI0013D696B7|nr:hypothetical protein [Fodinicola feengrottensis]
MIRVTDVTLAAGLATASGAFGAGAAVVGVGTTVCTTVCATSTATTAAAQRRNRLVRGICICPPHRSPCGRTGSAASSV